MKRRSIYSFLVLLYCLHFFWACTNTSFPQGERLYKANCANCHMDDGLGLSQLLPSLVDSDAILGNDVNLPCLITNGQGLMSNEGRTLPMPKFSSLSNIEINNIVNYIRTAWGHKASPLTLKDIEEALSDCEK